MPLADARYGVTNSDAPKRSGKCARGTRDVQVFAHLWMSGCFYTVWRRPAKRWLAAASDVITSWRASITFIRQFLHTITKFGKSRNVQVNRMYYWWILCDHIYCTRRAGWLIQSIQQFVTTQTPLFVGSSCLVKSALVKPDYYPSDLQTDEAF